MAYVDVGSPVAEAAGVGSVFSWASADDGVSGDEGAGKSWWEGAWDWLGPRLDQGLKAYLERQRAKTAFKYGRRPEYDPAQRFYGRRRERVERAERVGVDYGSLLGVGLAALVAGLLVARR